MNKLILTLSLLVIALRGYSAPPRLAEEGLDYFRQMDIAAYVDTLHTQLSICQLIEESQKPVIERLSSMIDDINNVGNIGRGPASSKLSGYAERLRHGLALVGQSDYSGALRQLRSLVDDINGLKYSYGDTYYMATDLDSATVKMLKTCDIFGNAAILACLFCDWGMSKHHNMKAHAEADPIEALIAYQYLMRLNGDIYVFCDGKTTTKEAVFDHIDTSDDEVHALRERINDYQLWQLMSHPWLCDYDVYPDNDRRQLNVMRYVKDNWEALEEIDSYPAYSTGDYGYIYLSNKCGHDYASHQNMNMAYTQFVESQQYIDERLPACYKRCKFLLYETALYNIIGISLYKGDFETLKKYLEDILDYFESFGQRYPTSEDIDKYDDPLASLCYALYNETYLHFLSRYYSVCYDSDLAGYNKDYRMPALANPLDKERYPVYTTDFAACSSYRDMDRATMKDYILHNALDFIGYTSSLIRQADRLYPDLRKSHEGYYLEWCPIYEYFSILRSLYFDRKGLCPHIQANSPDHINALGVIDDEIECFTNILNNGCAPAHYYLALSLLAEGKYQEAEHWFSTYYIYDEDIYSRMLAGTMALRCSQQTGNTELAQELGKDLSAQIRKKLYGLTSLIGHTYADIMWAWSEEACRQINNTFLSLGRADIYAADVYNNILTVKGYQTQFRNSLDRIVAQSGREELIGQYARLRALEKEYSEAGASASTAQINYAHASVLGAIETSVGADFLYNSDWIGVRSALDDSKCAIEFYMPEAASARAYALVVRAEYEYPHVIALDICNADCQMEEGLKALYDMVWRPLEAELQGVTTVYFSLDRHIDSLPVEYAIDNKGTMIGDKMRCMRVSSTKTLALQEPRADICRSAVLYGGLDFDRATATPGRGASVRDGKRSTTDPLWGSFEEVNALSDLLASNGYNCIKYTGAEGTEQTMAQVDGQELSILHLATHGLLFDDETLSQQYGDLQGVRLFDRLREAKDGNDELWRSALAMSGCNETLTGSHAAASDMEDGILTAAEISRLDLTGIDMVVLSSCHSGYYGGADGYGLQRGFKMAGANSLVLSLWDVDDEATQMFMSEFYKEYVAGADKYQAMRHAQQRVREVSEYSAPYFWAGFILVDGQ